MRTLFIIGSLLCVPVISQANTYFGDVNFTHITPSSEQAIWQASSQLPLKYPVELAKQMIIGCGIFNVEISAEGKTNKVSLISEVTNKKSLAKETIKTLKRFKWQPQAGQVAAASEQVIRLDYCLGGDSIESAQARCQTQAKLPCSKT
ncbi:energy transducer TonB [Pseudoalteromonas tunicata]|jgi:hypothetical protein|uniref:TonB C-terminal domain-containing protein n=1 Tax=Pseudoalteromonas tunicata D2 TaxID=87626 RepID=A4CBH5_9GAMM|nr:energy transducer TonB [Pseudoalteromonas tunicata]ATC94269.1 hypothetical protein PTUN_a1669 [Pseudoalteromonas tunicata]AXT30015.1 energy transducer TonB [Pseudoalteromonas tunicata]EAR27712.1 hypothetical protein PTD2_17860 [Pseudoalteromonas tunicata D2]MDP5211491.1 energy transducer TonB [Pseudoalteromonas tunicata]